MKKNDIYTLENYQHKKSFASFLPGIAGVDGIPMWCFFVNRGQCVTSFGIENKSKSILEFYPANKSFELVSVRGFRTFIKINNSDVYEAFSAYNKHVSHTMHIEKNLLTITEVNSDLDIKIQVDYFILPHEFFGSIVRSVSIENLGEERRLEVVDGVPEIIPSGMSIDIIKNMSFTARAWADVFHLEEGTPLYRVRSSIEDTESVEEISDGVFFVNVYQGKINKNLIVDRDILFANNNDLLYPVSFQNHSLQEILASTQYTENKYSSAFACIDEKELLKKGEKLNFQSYIGYAAHQDDFNKIIAYIETHMRHEHYCKSKKEESRTLVNGLVNEIYTETNYDMFDQYCKQSYLDNILRGGYPLVFPQRDSKKLAYHVYARKHGDLERDYNFFHLEAKYYSQGNGNFRDICQNRRNDVLFNPEIEDFNVITFLNLIQADGYNPYVVKGLSLTITDAQDIIEIEKKIGVKLSACMKSLLKEFTLGSLLDQANEDGILDTVDIEKIVSTFTWYAVPNRSADFGEGFWIDHFSYHLDLIESYLDIFPDRVHDLLFHTKISYYDSPARIRPRKEKYCYNKEKNKVVQHRSVEDITEKEMAIEKRGHRYLVDEEDNIYYGNAYEKLFCLVINKISSLDINGIGIEMEAGKPGWNDALNGMPGIIGSGVSELFELMRIVDFLIAQVQQIPSDESIEINEMMYVFAKNLSDIFKTTSSASTSLIERWDMTHTLRETYRENIALSIASKKIHINQNDMMNVLGDFRNQITKGCDTLFEHGIEIPPSFIENIITKYNIEDNKIQAQEITQRKLPLFLEAPAKSFYILTKKEAQELYKKIKESDIYDKKLKMYKTSESLEAECKDIGRAKAFTPGWLERESVFMHMQLKYLLKLLEKGLYNEFYEDIFTMIPCFMDDEVYGRPSSEASSFIVSSVNSNAELHGQGFSARLSGSTAEIISIWKYMFLGENLFCLNEGSLEFQLSPRLLGSFFPEHGVIRTTLFASICIEIHNPKRIDTFDVLPTHIECDGEKFEGNKVVGELAQAVRNKQVSIIKIYY